MARIRTIKPEFWDDEKIGSLTRDARLLFLATWNHADDEGLIRWNATHLRSIAFKYDEVVTDEDVTLWMASLVDMGLVFVYTAGAPRQPIAYIINFRKHQKINRPNPGKLAAPSLQSAAAALMYAVRDNYTCHLCGNPIPREYHGHPTDPYDPASGPDLYTLNASLDHVTPRSLGGSDYPSNIKVAHVGCNKGRANRPVSDFKTPPSVEHALAEMGSLNHAMSDSVNHSLNTDAPVVLGELPQIEPDEVDSLSDSLPHSLAEGKGREGKGREEEHAGSSDPELAHSKPANVRKLRKYDYTPEFEEAWTLYERKGDKAQAFAEWLKALDRADEAVILSAIPTYLASQRDPKFRKDFCRWLAGDLWEASTANGTAGAGPLRELVRDPNTQRALDWA